MICNPLFVSTNVSHIPIRLCICSVWNMKLLHPFVATIQTILQVSLIKIFLPVVKYGCSRNLFASFVPVNSTGFLLEFKQQHSGFPMDIQCAISAPTFCLNYISQSPSLWFEYTGLLRILRTECVQRVSESFFSFYIDYPSQK